MHLFLLGAFFIQYDFIILCKFANPHILQIIYKAIGLVSTLQSCFTHWGCNLFITCYVVHNVYDDDDDYYFSYYIL